jgi:hypothetical protein
MRSRDYDRIDWDNVIEELEDVGRSEKRQLINRLAILIMHLLKGCDSYRNTMYYRSLIDDKPSRVIWQVKRQLDGIGLKKVKSQERIERYASIDLK